MSAESRIIFLPILTNLGTDYRCYKIARTLKQNGWHPVILCDKPRMPPGAVWKDIEIIELTKISHLENFFLSFLIFNTRLFFYLLRHSCEKIIVEDCAPLLSSSIAGRLKGTEVIYDSHEIFLETEHVNSQIVKKNFWYIWHNLGFQFVRKIITVSPHFITHFRNKFPDKKYSMIPNFPLRKNSVPPVEPGEGVRLLFQGYLRNDTNLDYLMKAMISRPKINLFIAGEGEAQDVLKMQSDNLGLTSRIEFGGSVPFDRLAEENYNCQVGIHLVSPATKNMDLTWGNKIFEYCQKGIPVLASYTKGLDSIFEKYPVGIQVNPHDTQSILKGLDKIIEDYSILKGNCLKFQKELSWESLEGSLVDFIKS